jgi:hypothetical protein
MKTWKRLAHVSLIAGTCQAAGLTACGEDAETAAPPTAEATSDASYSGFSAGPSGETGLLDLQIAGGQQPAAHILADHGPRAIAGTLVLSSVVGPFVLAGTVDAGANVTFSGTATSALGVAPITRCERPRHRSARTRRFLRARAPLARPAQPGAPSPERAKQAAGIQPATGPPGPRLTRKAG